MNLYFFLFWGLVFLTALVSLRWGAMIGLVFFVFTLMFGAVAVSRLSPPKADRTAGALLVRRGRAKSAAFRPDLNLFNALNSKPGLSPSYHSMFSRG